MRRLGIEDLRRLGEPLRQRVLPLRLDYRAGEVIQKGAAGDKTFQIDKVAEDVVFEFLRESSVPLTVVSEERGIVPLRGGGERVLLDPIDGSKNAVSGIPLYCTSVAVSEDDTLQGLRLAYIYNIITGDEYWAERGRGAYLNGRRLETDTVEEIRVVLYETQRPGRDIPVIMPLLGLANRTRCLGATALDLAFLASGGASVYVNPAPTRSFDFAAGVLLVKEAGGIVTDLKGEDLSQMELSMKRTSPLLVSANRQIHEKALEALNE